MSELEFVQCMKDIDSGNKNALKNIYDNYGYAMYAYALSIVKDSHMAEDICQEVFIKVWNNSGKYKKKYNPKAWIMTITKNTSIDYLRKHKKEELNDDVQVAVHSDMANEVDNRIHINEVLNTLHEEEKEVVLLHLISDLTFKSIGDILNKPLGTVTWRYREGIKKLRSRINL